jgi:hypothetical protein
MSSAFVGSEDHVKKDDHVNYYTRKYVESVKAGDEEKEICK